MYKVIDLFAGAGGLSLGFLQTKKYDIKVAFENNPNMQETYRLNHPNVDVRGDVCTANYSEIQDKYGPIDVVIGGPPCQGFSNANRQKYQAINQNNMLVKEYIRAILELQPKAFIMENVSMLRSESHRFYLNIKDEPIIKKYKIPIKETELQLIEKDYYFDGAVDIIKDPEKINAYLWPESEYSELNIIYKATRNPKKLLTALEKHKSKLTKIVNEHVDVNISDHILNETYQAISSIQGYYIGTIEASELQSKIAPAVMIQRMLRKAIEICNNKLIVNRYIETNGVSVVIYSYAVYDYMKAILESDHNGYVINSKVLCAADYGAPQKRMRFVVMGIKKTICNKVTFPNGRFKEDQYQTVRDAISDIENVKPFTNLADDVGIQLNEIKYISDLGSSLRNSSILRNHIITCTTGTVLQRFRALKQGQNFHALDESLKTNTYTDTSRTQNTIYLRLNYNEPCGTVINVRKSMWIHPTLDRAVSIREAARLQTFPDSFVFCGSKDKQYQQVGNAVPPIMAKSIAKKLASLLACSLTEQES